MRFQLRRRLSALVDWEPRTHRRDPLATRAPVLEQRKHMFPLPRNVDSGYIRWWLMGGDVSCPASTRGAIFFEGLTRCGPHQRNRQTKCASRLLASCLQLRGAAPEIIPFIGACFSERLLPRKLSDWFGS